MPNMAFIGCKAGWNPTSKRSFSCRMKNNVIMLIYFTALKYLKIRTGVSSTGKNRNCLTSAVIANLSSSMAKRIPMQLRGPAPNAMKLYGLRLTLFSGFHLEIRVQTFCHYFYGAIIKICCIFN